MEFSCDKKCAKRLSCGNHDCEKICHGGDCGPCSKSPELLNTCACGKKPMEDLRSSCLDPVMTCGEVCGRTLKCGPPGKLNNNTFSRKTISCMRS